MRAAVAISAVNGATWRPGLHVVAMPDTFLSSDYIRVEVIFDTYDSSIVNDAGEYTRRIKVAPVFDVNVKYFETEDELLFKVLSLVREAQEHEDREFLRVRRPDKTGWRWTAPFHPHNESGQRLWDSKGKKWTTDDSWDLGRAAFR
jgi:hypothetical protein